MATAAHVCAPHVRAPSAATPHPPLSHSSCRRSKKAEKWLKSVKSRPDDGAAKLNAVENDALVKDFTALRAELKEEGFFEPQPMHVAYRFAEVLAMHALGFWLLLNGWQV